MFKSVWKVIDTTTYVDVTSGEYTKVYNIMFGIAVFVMLGFFMLQVIGGMIRREPAALSRAALGLAKSILGSFVALALLGTALEITDQLCIGIVNAAGTNMNEMGDKVAVLAAGLGAINLAAPGAGAILTIFLASLAIVGAMVVWISLLIRKALLLIAIVFAPIALAGSSWDHTRSWVSRWATFVIAMILSKVVLVVIFLLATAQVSAPIDADLESVSQPMAGVVLMLMAGFAPYLTYKAIAFMGFDMYHAMSAEQEAKASLNRPMPIPLSRRTRQLSRPRSSERRRRRYGGGCGTPAARPAAAPSGGGGRRHFRWRRRWRRSGGAAAVAARVAPPPQAVRSPRARSSPRRQRRPGRGSAGSSPPKRPDRPRPTSRRRRPRSRRQSRTRRSPSPPDGSDPTMSTVGQHRTGADADQVLPAHPARGPARAVGTAARDGEPRRRHADPRPVRRRRRDDVPDHRRLRRLGVRRRRRPEARSSGRRSEHAGCGARPAGSCSTAAAS